ncbi:MAG: DUF4252 domain-containing protein [Bacteroidales bacterium]|nr:DUF4252 domain-containing protein [Bacteroidales bacterium]
MKRLFFLLLLWLPVAAMAASPEGRIPKTQLTAFISEYRHCEGVEVVRLGRAATAAIKGAVRIASVGDADARQARELMKGLKSLYVFDFSACSPALRDRMNRQLNRIFRNTELLMEVTDQDDQMQIYGLYDEQSDLVRDFVLYTPSDCALICLFGSFSMDTVSRMMAND